VASEAGRPLLIRDSHHDAGKCGLRRFLEGPVGFLFVNKTLASFISLSQEHEKTRVYSHVQPHQEKAATEEATDYGTANYCITQFPEAETFKRKSFQTDV